MKNPNYLSISRATLHNWGKDYPDFPKGRKMGPHRVIFVLSEVEAWLASRPAK